MIYITQLIFIKNGKEAVFQEFEKFAIALMEKYGGRMVYRWRPTPDSVVSAEESLPYEVHFCSFESEKDLEDFMKDDERLKYIHLKNESIQSAFIVKGLKL